MLGLQTDGQSSTTWYVERRDQVLHATTEFAQGLATTKQQGRLFDTALTTLRSQAHKARFSPFIHLPLLVYAGICGREDPARQLAVATSLLYLGCDILDDLADEDLAPSWAEYRRAEIHLMASGLIGPMLQLALAETDAPAPTIIAMERTVSRSLLRMGAGQQADVTLAGGHTLCSAEVMESVAAKSGEEFAIFASLAAQLARAPAALVQEYAALGRALGIASQLLSDCYDLFVAANSRDLANGTRTLPLVLYLERQSEAEISDFLTLLDRARWDDAAQKVVRQRLLSSGDYWRTRMIIEVYRQQALGALRRAEPCEPARSRLEAILDRLSLMGSTQTC